jgi:hypothetical protein
VCSTLQQPQQQHSPLPWLLLLLLLQKRQILPIGFVATGDCEFTGITVTGDCEFTGVIKAIARVQSVN